VPGVGLLLQRRDNLQPRPYGPHSIIFMGSGLAKVHEQTVAEILGDVSFVALDHLGAGLLVRADDGVPVFGVELR
jgi:hypothetical protein